MTRYRFYFEDYAEYIADTVEEARAMFNNDHFSGSAMDIEEIDIENDIDK